MARGPKAQRVNGGERQRIAKDISARFISPKVRRARVEAAYQFLGYRTLASFAEDKGMYPASVARSLDAPSCSIVSLFRLAVALDCSINYLTDVDYFKKGGKGK